MKKPAANAIKIFAALSLACLLVVFAFQAGKYIVGSHNAPAPQAGPAASNVFKSTGPLTAETFRSLKWEDIDGFVGADGADPKRRRQVLDLTSGMPGAAAVYLRGLFFLIERQPAKALEAFDTIAADAIPATFLYAPYRLHEYMKPSEANRYREFLLRAAARGEVSPLIQARLQAQEGNLFAALSNYLRTDPALWAGYDIECLRKMANHSGLASEVRKMVAGALKSNRLDREVADELRKIFAPGSANAEAREFKRLLKEELVRNGSGAKMAIASAANLLETRKLFMERNYTAVLERHEKATPMALTTETVLVLFLSALQVGNRLEVDRWGQEIKRRYPFREAIDWVNGLTSAAK